MLKANDKNYFTLDTNTWFISQIQTTLGALKVQSLVPYDEDTDEEGAGACLTRNSHIKTKRIMSEQMNIIVYILYSTDRTNTHINTDCPGMQAPSHHLVTSGLLVCLLPLFKSNIDSPLTLNKHQSDTKGLFFLIK